MPRIKAYKNAGKIIPVADAKIGTAFECPWTGKLFGDKRGYVAHLKALRADRIHRQIRLKRMERLKDELWTRSDFDSVISWIELHPEVLFDAVMDRGHEGWADRRAHLRSDFWIKITYLKVQYSDSVSNSHSAPHGKQTNWGGDKKDVPRGYPGWSGHIEFQLSHDLSFGSDILKTLRIHTGSGGGTSGQRYGYGVTFWADDWPGMNMMRALTDGSENTVIYGEPRYFK